MDTSPNPYDQFEPNPFDKFDSNAETPKPTTTKGIFDDPRIKDIGRAVKTVGEAPYKAGGAVTDFGANIGLPPEVSAGAGYLTNVSLEALPMLFGGSGAKAASIPLQDVGKELMQSALKPTIKQLKSGDAATAIDTMLEGGYNATAGGVKAIKEQIGKLNDQIADAIAGSSASIKKSDVGQSLIALLDKFKKQVNPTADMNAVREAWLDFRNHPLLAGKTDIPVQLAQELKQGTYQQLAKKYGQIGTAEVEAQKGLARGLKEGIAKEMPEVAGLNAQESALIRTLNVAERRSLMDLNKNPMGLSLLAHSPAAWAAFMADKSALFKSLAARAIYSGSEQIPATAARGGIALSEIGSGMGRE